MRHVQRSVDEHKPRQPTRREILYTGQADAPEMTRGKLRARTRSRPGLCQDAVGQKRGERKGMQANKIVKNGLPGLNRESNTMCTAGIGIQVLSQKGVTE